jgi:hypothetical protein
MLNSVIRANWNTDHLNQDILVPVACILSNNRHRSSAVGSIYRAFVHAIRRAEDLQPRKSLPQLRPTLSSDNLKIISSFLRKYRGDPAVMVSQVFDCKSTPSNCFPRLHAKASIPHTPSYQRYNIKRCSSGTQYSTPATPSLTQGVRTQHARL